MKDLISIIMTVKNGAQHLVECIDSIQKQSHSNWQLLVIDNNSTDNTLKVLRSYDQDERITIVENRMDSKIPEALFKLVPLVKGKYISRMDADDVMHPDKLKLLLENLVDQNSISVGLVKYFPDEVVQEGYRKYEKWLNTSIQSYNPYKQIYKECIIPAPSWLIHKSTFDRIGGIQNVIPEDYDFAFRCYSNQININTTKEVVHYWREHNERNSRHDPDYEDNNFFEIKIKYFLECEYKKETPLIVWGAGKKGKLLVKLLQEQNVTPIWITDNDKKIGKDIYGIVLKQSEYLKSLSVYNVIVALSSPEDINFIQEIEKEESNIEKQFFFFC